MTRHALLAGLLCWLASASVAVANCRDWTSAPNLPVGQILVSSAEFEIRGNETFELKTSVGISLLLQSATSETVRIRVFRDPTGYLYLVPRRIDQVIDQGGRTVFSIPLDTDAVPFEILDRMSDGVSERTCLNYEREVHLLSVRAARSKGYRLADEVVAPPVAEGPRVIIVPPGEPLPEEKPSLAEALNGIVGSEVESEESVVASEDEGGLGGLFGSPVVEGENAAAATGLAGLSAAARNVPDTIVPSPSDTIAETAGFSVCMAEGGEPIEWYGAQPAADYSMALKLSKNQTLDLFEYLEITNDFIPLGAQSTIPSTLDKKMTVLRLPNGLRRKGRAVADPVFASLPAMPTAFDVEKAPKAAVEVDPLINILVVSDAQTPQVAGFEAFEEQLIAAYGKQLWRVEWVRVQSDGTLSEPEAVASLADIPRVAKDESGQFFPQTAAPLSIFADQLVQTLETAPQQIDLVVFVIEGQILPHATPVILSDMIARVEETGNVPRRGRGDARKWLLVASGFVAPEYPLGYLEGPLSESRRGEFVAETPDDGNRASFFGTSGAAFEVVDSALQVASRAADKPVAIADIAEPDLPTAGPFFFDLSKVEADYGLLVARASIPAFRQALNNSLLVAQNDAITLPKDPELIDTYGLFLASTDAAGASIVRELTSQGLRRSRDALASVFGPGINAKLASWHIATSSALATSVPDACSHVFIRMSGLL